MDAVMEKMNDLRKGKSAVKEWEHSLLIGWTDRSLAFITQVHTHVHTHTNKKGIQAS